MGKEGKTPMSHSLVKIWIHGVFGTKDRASLINSTIEKGLHLHIKERLEKDLDCKVRIINGTEDHVHVLFLLSPNFSTGDIFHSIKGESSYWMNKENIIIRKFAWQIGYGAFSVSESQVMEVEQYIRNQKEHHKKISYAGEIDLLIKKYGLQVING